MNYDDIKKKSNIRNVDVDMIKIIVLVVLILSVLLLFFVVFLVVLLIEDFY